LASVSVGSRQVSVTFVQQGCSCSRPLRTNLSQLLQSTICKHIHNKNSMVTTAPPFALHPAPLLQPSAGGLGMGGGGGTPWERTMAKTAARIDNRIRIFISVRVSIIPDARMFFLKLQRALQVARERGIWGGPLRHPTENFLATAVVPVQRRNRNVVTKFPHPISSRTGAQLNCFGLSLIFMAQLLFLLFFFIP
jgi:hypothetical protein